MVVVKDYLSGRILGKAKFLAGLIPELMAVGKDFRSFHAIHHDNAVICQDRQHLAHDFFEVTPVASNKDSIRKPHPRPLPNREGSR